MCVIKTYKWKPSMPANAVIESLCYMHFSSTMRGRYRKQAECSQSPAGENLKTHQAFLTQSYFQDASRHPIKYCQHKKFSSLFDWTVMEYYYGIKDEIISSIYGIKTPFTKVFFFDGHQHLSLRHYNRRYFDSKSLRYFTICRRICGY